jgi:hypothetical protein
MNVRVLLLCAGLGGLLGGCGSPSAETGRNSSPPVVFTLKPEEPQSAVTVRLGDELRVVIPNDRGPGFAWQLVTNDPRALRQSSKLAAKAETTSVAFIAQRPSRSYLRFVCVPADSGKETEFVEAYQIAVTVRP